MAQAIPTYYISYFNLTEELCEMCAVCHRDVEDGGHLFFHCKYVKRVWQALGMEERRVMLEFDSPLMVIVQILQLEERERLQLLMGYLDWYHYNFHKLKISYYNSPNWRYSIKISFSPP